MLWQTVWWGGCSYSRLLSKLARGKWSPRTKLKCTDLSVCLFWKISIFEKIWKSYIFCWKFFSREKKTQLGVLFKHRKQVSRETWVGKVSPSNWRWAFLLRGPPVFEVVEPFWVERSCLADVWKIEIFEQLLVFFHPKKWIFCVFKLFGELKPSLQFISDLFWYILAF